jgi:hypothetical protein
VIRRGAGRSPATAGPARSGVSRLCFVAGRSDELFVEEGLAFGPADRDDLVALAQDRLGPERDRLALADDREEGAALGDGQILGRASHRRRPLLEVGLDEFQLAFAERGQVEQLGDRDVLLDRAEDHPGGADDLVDAQVPEQLLVLGVVHPRDRPADREVVLGHLADDEVVLVVAGDCGDDVGPVAARLTEVLALAAVVSDDDRADLIGDLVRP